MAAVALEWNTKLLLSAASGMKVGECVPIEYHLRSEGQLYDKSLVKGDDEYVHREWAQVFGGMHRPDSVEWILGEDPYFYTLSVVSWPAGWSPQELCLSFNCFVRSIPWSMAGAEGHYEGPPADEIASEFAVLLSLFVREPILPLGTRLLCKDCK